MIEPKRELKERRDSYIEEGDNSTFYRYDVDGTKVWFVQYDNGSIYHVNIRPSDKLDNLEFNVSTEKNYPYIYYPYKCNIVSPLRILSGDYDIDCYIELLKYAQKVSNAIMDIFNLDLHKNV